MQTNSQPKGTKVVISDRAEVTVKVKLDYEGHLGLEGGSTVWQFLNSHGHWVDCIGGEDHAKGAALADGPGKYRRVYTIVQTEERAT